MSSSFSSNGQQLASGSFDQSIRQWNLFNGECTQTLTEPTGIICLESGNAKLFFVYAIASSLRRDAKA